MSHRNMRNTVSHRNMLREVNNRVEQEQANKRGEVFNQHFEAGIEGYKAIAGCDLVMDTIKDRVHDEKVPVLKVTATSPTRCGLYQVGLSVTQGKIYTLSVSGCSTSRSKPFVQDVFSGEYIAWEESPALEMGLHLTNVWVTFVAVSSQVNVGVLFVKPKQGENMYLGKISMRPSNPVDVSSTWNPATKIKQMEEFVRKWQWKLDDTTNAASVFQFALNEPNCTFPALKARVTKWEPFASPSDRIGSKSCMVLTRKAAGPGKKSSSTENHWRTFYILHSIFPYV